MDSSSSNELSEEEQELENAEILAAVQEIDKKNPYFLSPEKLGVNDFKSINHMNKLMATKLLFGNTNNSTNGSTNGNENILRKADSDMLSSMHNRVNSMGNQRFIFNSKTFDINDSDFYKYMNSILSPGHISNSIKLNVLNIDMSAKPVKYRKIVKGTRVLIPNADSIRGRYTAEDILNSNQPHNLTIHTQSMENDIIGDKFHPHSMYNHNYYFYQKYSSSPVIIGSFISMHDRIQFRTIIYGSVRFHMLDESTQLPESFELVLGSHDKSGDDNVYIINNTLISGKISIIHTMPDGNVNKKEFDISSSLHFSDLDNKNLKKLDFFHDFGRGLKY